MKKLLCIIMTLTLLCGLFTVNSKAEDIEPEDTTTAIVEIESEEVTKEEILEETTEVDEEIIEDEETTEIIDEEETVEDDSLDDLSFINEFVGQDEIFEYYITYDEDFNPDGGLCLNSFCKHCHYGITEEATREEIKERFGVDVNEWIK